MAVTRIVARTTSKQDEAKNTQETCKTERGGGTEIQTSDSNATSSSKSRKGLDFEAEIFKWSNSANR